MASLMPTTKQEQEYTLRLSAVLNSVLMDLTKIAALDRVEVRQQQLYDIIDALYGFQQHWLRVASSMGGYKKRSR